ncbi:IclR family transcriptional regulator [Pararhizobium sp. IMCC21322]|uniref:IclR family transcriptional regulator n=1 Tax=Pararhizobium sp. IMCC21322 TaxID=3067903 RepID=UPI0027426A2A|nr:IclR family transcriptional regulator [Pararhizobium sp. IMCC21322]
MTDQNDTNDTIPTNLRLLFVLEELSNAGVPMTPTEINQKLGLPKPTIHRLFSTLESEGFLQREIDGRSYAPGRRLRHLSMGVLSSLRVRTARLSVLNALAEHIGETCNISVPDRDSMIYIDRVETKWPLRIQLPIGTSVPFYCTASGKLYLSKLKKAHLERYLASVNLERRTPKTITDQNELLAEIKKTRSQGYSEDNEEFMEGMIAIAVPIIDVHGRLVSTLSFHAPTQRLSLKDAGAHLDRLRAGADDLAQLLV